MKKAVVFDLDGTLSDSLDSITISANKAIGAFGFAPYERERYKYFVGDGADELLRRCLIHDGDTELAYFDRVREEYQKVFEEYCMYHVKPYDGIRKVLSELKKRGVKIAVLSNKPHPRTLDVIYDLFGEGYFDCVQGQKPEVERKPSPEGVFAISRELGIAVEDMLYVGDTGTDMKTGTGAGAYTIGVLWGFREREELEEHHADAIISHPMELLDYLDAKPNAEAKQHSVEAKRVSAEAKRSVHQCESGAKPRIRMIATDIDGTLVKDSSPEIYEEFPQLITKLTDAGYIVAAASGRAYPSIRNMFRTVSDKLAYIAENGAHIIVDGKDFSIVKMKRELVEGIMQDLRTLYPQGCNVVVSTPGCTMIESKDQTFIDFMLNNYHNKIKLTEDVLAENVDILKLAVHRQGSIREIGESFLIPKWESKAKTCMAGEEWVDFMDLSVDKGNALRTLQEHFGIRAEETMVFGDNANDIGMLQAAGESYAVENARDEVKNAAKYTCPGYEQRGVYNRLCKLMEGQV